MKANKTKLSFAVVIDWDHESVSIKGPDDSRPVPVYCSSEKKDIAIALRDIAWYALEKAAFIEKQSPVTDLDIMKQADEMELQFCLPFH